LSIADTFIDDIIKVNSTFVSWKLVIRPWTEIECDNLNCDDNNLCTLDSCDPFYGCQNQNISCDDFNPVFYFINSKIFILFNLNYI
jgi:hypothetical protein